MNLLTRLMTAAAVAATLAACGGGSDQQPPAAAEPGALSVDAGCCNGNADTAVGLVWALQAAMDLPNDAPVTVSGADPTLAAQVAARLAAGGLTQVRLVTL